MPSIISNLLVSTHLVVGGASCPPTKLVNVNLLIKAERAAFEKATKSCPLLYPESPCLVKFEQTRSLSFQATCGGKK